MKLSIARNDFLKCLSHVQSVVEKRNTIPILSNVLLETKEGALTLCATDMDLEITDSVPATVSSQGATTVPAHTLYDIVRKLPDSAQVDVEVNNEGSTMTIKAGRSTFKLGCLPREDFPEMTGGETPHEFDMPASNLRDLIDKTRFAISTEETRYYLNGIYIHAAQNDNMPVLRAVATDGHRLARFEMPLPEGSGNMPGVIVPRKTIQELRKLLDEAGDTIHLALSDKKICFIFDHITLTSKLIDGTFPDYERVIPKGNNKILDIDPRLFAKAVDRVSTISSEKSRAVKMTINDKTMTLSANSPESGSAVEELEISFDEEPLDIGFNAKYLLDVTSQLEGETCRFIMSDSASPTIVQDNSDPSSLYVLMPMRV